MSASTQKQCCRLGAPVSSPEWRPLESGLPAVGPISWATEALGLVFTSHVPVHSDGTFELGEFDTQAALTLDNLSTALAAADCGTGDVLQVLVFLTDMADSKPLADLWLQHFRPPYPNRAIVGVCALGVPGMRIEIVATALSPRRGQ
jgi:enamine deaminase RidA (YjgF/YER057c/UK114 family)